MATNREKYIDNASDRELAITLSVGAYVDDKNNFVLMVSDANCQERAKKIEKWLSQKIELTADEMFEELGYKKNEKNSFITYDSENYIIKINKGNHSRRYEYIKYIPEYAVYNKTKEGKFESNPWERTINESRAEYLNSMIYITDDEDKAIHKKIEELKNEN